MKSKLIQSVDNEAVVLVDGTRIEADTSYNEYGHGTPCGFDVSDAITPTDRRAHV